MFQRNIKLYKLWYADLWQCPICKKQIVAGFAKYNFAEHYHYNDDKNDLEKNLERVVERLKAEGKTVIYDKEVIKK